MTRQVDYNVLDLSSAKTQTYERHGNILGSSPPPEVGHRYCPSTLPSTLRRDLAESLAHGDDLLERCDISTLADSVALPGYPDGYHDDDDDDTVPRIDDDDTGGLDLLESQTLETKTQVPLPPIHSSTHIFSKAQKQLSDPNTRLIHDVLQLIAGLVAKTSLRPAAKILDPLWWTPGLQEMRIRTNLPRSVGGQDVYIPLHHPSSSPNWSLAVLRPGSRVLEHYDSLHSSHRDNLVKASFDVL
ncbi:hypothetical protein BGZ61DRAFT_482516 [Ilyonectria robusta]|uniref:uncharacterized protein n=1 Tax=Ilyonectria robusta TaxID=1079257 RepID=UPI001E8E69AA|nr:uncharacterized protein BGZ61DRAFT_482516 [Ilyonectria robusta]KAH8672169.1 hypothetical protein BGZ61DRAFT_482516 [Ilyonectria robusta]